MALQDRPADKPSLIEHQKRKAFAIPRDLPGGRWGAACPAGLSCSLWQCSPRGTEGVSGNSQIPGVRWTRSKVLPTLLNGNATLPKWLNPSFVLQTCNTSLLEHYSFFNLPAFFRRIKRLKDTFWPQWTAVGGSGNTTNITVTRKERAPWEEIQEVPVILFFIFRA